MWIFRSLIDDKEEKFWAVGFYNNYNQTFEYVDYFTKKEDAAKRVHYLNGGDNNPRGIFGLA